MFLFILILFPIISYYLFRNTDYKESNGVVKLIGVIGVFILSLLIVSRIFNNKESYLVLIFLWYIGIFLYYLLHSIKKEYKNLSEITYTKLSLSEIIIKAIILFLLFILYIIFWKERNFNIDLRNGNIFVNTMYFFLLTIVFYGVLYEFIDMVKNSVFRRKIDYTSYREKLKKEVKEEILMELKA